MIISPKERQKEFAELTKGITKKGLSTGFESIDEYMKLATSYLAIITGVPGSGKSEFLDAVVINMTLMHGWKTAYFSPENYPLENHMSKLAEKFIGKHIKEFKKEDTEKALDFLEENFKWIYPEEPELDTILNGALRIKEASGLDCLVIDPWNAVTHKRNNAMVHEYLAEALSKLIRFGRTQNVLIAVVAHPTKPQKDKDGNYAPLNLYDISDGAMWRNRCDYGIIVNRPDMSKNEIEVVMGKIKNKWMGKLGSARLDYDFQTGRFKCTYKKEFLLPSEIEPPF